MGAFQRRQAYETRLWRIWASGQGRLRPTIKHRIRAAAGFNCIPRAKGNTMEASRLCRATGARAGARHDAATPRQHGNTATRANAPSRHVPFPSIAATITLEILSAQDASAGGLARDATLPLAHAGRHRRWPGSRRIRAFGSRGYRSPPPAPQAHSTLASSLPNSNQHRGTPSTRIGVTREPFALLKGLYTSQTGWRSTDLIPKQARLHPR